MELTCGDRSLPDDQLLLHALGPRPLPSNTITPSLLADVVSAYVKRTTSEDLELLSKLGGPSQLLWDLRCVPAEGLSGGAADLERRRRLGGINEMPRRSLTPFWRLIWDAGADPMLRVLMVAAVVSFTLGLTFGENPKVEWIEGAAIFAAACIVIVVTAVNDYLKEKQFASLYAREQRHCSVIRDFSKTQKIDSKDLVIGDVIVLETGDEVPADAIVLTHHALKVDESSLTGESDLVTKMNTPACLDELRLKAKEIAAIKEAAERGDTKTGHHIVASPVVLSGTAVASGSGTALVVAVGVRSQVGKLFTKLAVDTEPTPLQNKLNALARDVGRGGFFAALLTLVVLVGEYWISYAVMDEELRPNGSAIASMMVEYLVTSITIVVVAVPEGLPLAVTISLAFSVGRMLKDQNYVRRLAACETMGGANEICSDKTGTLTKNQMEVEAFWNGSVLSVNIAQNSLEEIPLPFGDNKTILAHNIAVNSTAYLEKSLVDIADGTGRKKEIVKQVGSPTECALLQFGELVGFRYEETRRMFGGLSEANGFPYEAMTGKDLIVYKIPFSSDRKAMTTVVVHPDNPQLLRMFIKGAAEVVLRRCSQRIDSEGLPKPLPESKVQRIEAVIINQLASLALRTICLAYKDFSPSDTPDWQEVPDIHNPLFLNIERQFICLGIAGIRDPVREEVPGAVRRCQDAGIRVRMCTGDNLETAKQIALKANIFHPEKGGLAMLGPDFLKLIGGVVCERCQTEQCACDGSAEPEGVCRIETKDTEATQRKCCRRRKRDRDSHDGRRTRNDVLGNPQAFESIVDRLEVLARSQPNDKYALVTGLKARGAVVAVTGDGTNDAPALKKADVGFAMGIAGKEVAKQAADIVLLDDNFESIVRACKWGRNIYDNIRRFLQFQLTVNVVAVITAFVGAVVLRGSPLSAVQLLWVNLIMDTFAALALATEMPTDKLLDRPPHSRTEYLVNSMMFRNIAAQVVYQTAVMMAMIFSGDCWLPEWPFKYDEEAAEFYGGFTMFSTTCGNGKTVRSGRRFHPFSDREDYRAVWTHEIGPSRHYTYVFNTFVFMQAFNLVNARKIGAREFQVFSGILSNYWWIGILVFIVVGQILLVEFGGYALNCHLEGLTYQQWFICLTFGIGTWIVGFLVKLLPSSFVQRLPQTGRKEVNPLDEPTSLALASRGRISSGRISARMNIVSNYDPARVRASIISNLPKSSGFIGSSAVQPESVRGVTVENAV